MKNVEQHTAAKTELLREVDERQLMEIEMKRESFVKQQILGTWL